MSILDQLQSLAGGTTSGVGQEQQSSVSRALISAVSEHPGGVGGILNQFRQNGLGEHVDAWTNSQPGQPTPPLSAQQVVQGAGPGLLGDISQRTGLPPQVVTGALTTVLPLVMQHFTPNGQVPQGGELGGLAQGLLSRL